MRAAVCLLASLLLAAGCLGKGETQGPEQTPAALAASEPAEAPAANVSAPLPAQAAPAATLFATGDIPLLRPGSRVSFAGECPRACPPSPFVLEAAGVQLEVRVRWDGTTTAGVQLEVLGPNGSVLPSGRGFDAARVLLPAAQNGSYFVRLSGEGPVEGWVSVRTAGTPRGNGSDLAPNLVTLVPAGVRVADCDPWEQVEQAAKRCLRLGNGIGNTGDGPLEVALSLEQGLGTLAGSGRFVQRVFQAEGAPREVPVGAADFHRAHAHFHYDGLARFSLHPVDPASGLRGEPVTEHRKAGFCLLDIGAMEEPDAEPEERDEARAEQACLIPKNVEGWTMGVSRGYYDYYGAGLTDQYVEITNVPDGRYELVSTCNWNGSLLELDPADNAASVLLELKGGKVEVLEERGFYRLPE